MICNINECKETAIDNIFDGRFITYLCKKHSKQNKTKSKDKQGKQTQIDKILKDIKGKQTQIDKILKDMKQNQDAIEKEFESEGI